jgi:hypothetical protein
MMHYLTLASIQKPDKIMGQTYAPAVSLALLAVGEPKPSFFAKASA